MLSITQIFALFNQQKTQFFDKNKLKFMRLENDKKTCWKVENPTIFLLLEIDF